MVKFREYLRGGIVSDRIDKKFKFDLEQERYFNSKYYQEKSKDENIHNLQDSWSILNEVKSDLLEHVKRNHETELMLQRLEQIYIDIRTEMDDILSRLENMGSHRNIELENLSFNFKSALKESDEYNPLLPNYIQISNRFMNAAKIDMSARPNNPPTFRACFKSPDSYDNVIMLLVRNDFVEGSGTELKWIKKKEGHCSPERFLALLFLYLDDAKYLKKNYKHPHIEQKQAAKLLSDTFKMTLSPQVYSKAKNANNKDYFFSVYEDFIPRNS